MIRRGRAAENVEQFMTGLRKRNPDQLEFHQAAKESIKRPKSPSTALGVKGAMLAQGST